MTRPPTIAAGMLADSRSEMLQLAEAVARTHHERWDGGGYPTGLSGEEIPLAGRIAAICDVYDALMSPRPYKDAWPQADALAEIASQRGRQFDPELVDAFLELWPADVRPQPAAHPAPPPPARSRRPPRPPPRRAEPQAAEPLGFGRCPSPTSPPPSPVSTS